MSELNYKLLLEHEGTFSSDGNVLVHTLNGGYMGVNIYKFTYMLYF